MAVNNAGYIASQQKRWQEANKNDDKDLMGRLQADSRRVGYELSPYQQAVKSVANQTNTPQPQATLNAINVPNQVKPPTQDTLGRFDQSTRNNFNFTAPKEFSYDYNTDPAYQAALNSARQNITNQQADTNAFLRASGQGKSSYSETLANQIGAKEMGRISNEVLPQLISQAYQRYADQANRDMQVQQMNYGVTQDQLSNLANLYSLQNREYFENPMSEAQLTGQYLSGEARGYINAINSLKAQAERPDITRDERNLLSSQADEYRRALVGLGVDSGLFGADVNRATALGNVKSAGTRTLSGQQLDEGTRQFNTEFDFSKERAAVADQQWQQELQRALANDANSRALGWANHNLSARRESRLSQPSTDGSSGNSGNSASTNSKYNFKTDPEFANELKLINASDAATFRKDYVNLLENPDIYMNQYGYDGYQRLLNAAEDRKKAIDSVNKQINNSSSSNPLLDAIRNKSK